MIDVRQVRQDPAAARAALARRGDASILSELDRVIELDRRRRDLLQKGEEQQAVRNRRSARVGQVKAMQKQPLPPEVVLLPQ